jgi:acetyl-CoA carboxylase biotin carboxyl carrier protein
VTEVGPDSEVFEVNRVKSLIKLMRENDLSEIDLRHGERRIRLRRGDQAPAQIIMGNPGYAGAPYPAPPYPTAHPMSTHAMPTHPMMASSANPSAGATAAAAEPDDEASAQIIKSPMVGTFYSKPNPDAKAYVQIGDQVTPETIVCQIEAMKMFSEIPAGVSGTIKAILVKNEEAVDVNKPLFKVV